MKKLTLSAFLLAVVISIHAQNPEKPHLVTGPVIGSVTKNSALVWIAYKGNGQNMMTLKDTSDNSMYYPESFHKINGKNGVTALTMGFKGLKPDHVYKPVFIDPLTIHPKSFVRTLQDSGVVDFNFIVGSCALLNTDWSRFIFPGPNAQIFFSMKRQKSNFMVWLGDNIYYLGKQYTSYQRMFDRNLTIRNEFPLLAELLAAQPNYAIWDDHDYGCNDCDRKFPLKDSALVVFKGFWPNPYPDTMPFKGNYFTFRQYDAEFFMTDDRWYRDTEGDSAAAFLGKEQLAWLKKELKKSDATFKFICVGSQVLDDSYYGESYAKYPKERNELFDYIADSNIKGVIFLSGDRHYSELSKRVWKSYTFYDFTSSPLTSPIVPLRYLKGYKNNYTIDSTILYRKNFGKVSISGPTGNRVCKLELYGKGGKRKWAYNISSNELQRKEGLKVSAGKK